MQNFNDIARQNAIAHCEANGYDAEESIVGVTADDDGNELLLVDGDAPNCLVCYKDKTLQVEDGTRHFDVWIELEDGDTFEVFSSWEEVMAYINNMS